jgi:hypothetical protein
MVEPHVVHRSERSARCRFRLSVSTSQLAGEGDVLSTKGRLIADDGAGAAVALQEMRAGSPSIARNPQLQAARQVVMERSAGEGVPPVAHLPPDSRFRFARTRFLTGTIAAFVAGFALLPFASASAPAVRAASEASAFSRTIFLDSAAPVAPPAAIFIRRIATTDWTSRLNFTASIQALTTHI